MTTDNPNIDWVAQTSEEHEEPDEPPELLKRIPSSNFRRTTIRRPSEQPSLLTKAIMGHSDDDIQVQHHEIARPSLNNGPRRRSMASNVSIASTADLTSDTGLTSPSRPNTPSPPLPEMAMLQLNADGDKTVSLLGAAVRKAQLDAHQEAPRKRSIQFACAKPVVQEPPRPQPMIRVPSEDVPRRRPCIKFACPARPASTQNTPPTKVDTSMSHAVRNGRTGSPSTPKKHSMLLPPAPISPQRTTPRRPSITRPAFLHANSTDMINDGSQFHEFASGTAREDDWIRQGNPQTAKKLTIDDTLTKENHIRRLAVEAEEEEELENEEADAALDDEDDEDEDDLDDDLDELDLDLDDDDEDDDDEYDEDDDEDEEDDLDDSDGYHTDEETGFAASDDEADDDENMVMWTPGRQSVIHTGPQMRRPSLHEQRSDSSIATLSNQTSPRHVKPKRRKSRSETPDLPDSTDFVCGTLDEDRPLEEAYLSCLAARKKEKLRLIPQDIDPSFPASDNDEEEEIFNPVHHDSDEEEWMHGEMEDIHHEQDRPRRRRRSEHASPKRFRSPPPKRHHSPPPKGRARSPKPLFDRHSPRRMRSPNRKHITTPLGSPRCGQIEFNLAGRPVLHTKSLPRGALFAQLKHVKHHHKAKNDDDVHVRGAIDIVKGLERKRQRRKEKFHQKYCNRARRGQLPERKPLPGRGAERMRELGLIMAGKKDQGNYVLSV